MKKVKPLPVVKKNVTFLQFFLRRMDICTQDNEVRDYQWRGIREVKSNGYGASNR